MAKLLFLEFFTFIIDLFGTQYDKLGGSILNANNVKMNRIVLFNTHFLVM